MKKTYAAIIKYSLRRAERLKKRGVRLDSKEERYDAGARLAYGIAKSMGIDTTGMAPQEVWEAINKKGGPGAAAKGGKVEGAKGKVVAKGSISKGHVSREASATAKRVGGYARKNNFSKGYGATVVAPEDKATRAGFSTRKYTNDAGEWTAEREAIHSQIIDKAFEGKKKADGKPKCVFLGGGPASGKSYVAKKLGKQVGLPPDDQTIKADPDECKKPLPEYDADDPELVHEESSALAKRITAISQNEGYNTLVDGTGDGSVGSMKKKIAQAKAAGQEVVGRYVFMPVEDAIVLNAKRDRSVNPAMLVNTHKKITSILPEIAADFDDCKLFANVIGGEPKLIAHGGGGKGLTVVDQDLFDKFMANGQYEYSEERARELTSGVKKKR